MIAATVSAGPHLFWLASRALGIVAMILLTVSVLIGLSMGGRFSNRLGKQTRQRFRIEPKNLARIHEQLSLVALIAIAGHGLTLLGDHYLHPSITQIALPFTIAYRPVYTGLGIIGGYTMAILGLTYYLRDHIGPKTWRKLHMFTIIGYGLSVVHSLGSGTDAGQAWLKYPMLGSALVVAVMLWLRIRSGIRKRDAGLPAGEPNLVITAGERSGRSTAAERSAARRAAKAGRAAY